MASFMKLRPDGQGGIRAGRFSSRSSSYPTQATASRLEVKPANQPSCEVPVLPAAGNVNPRDRAPAPVPLLMTLSSKVDHQVGNPRIQHLAGHSLAPPQQAPGSIIDGQNKPRLDVGSAVGKNRVSAGDFQRRRHIRSQGNGGRGQQVAG